MSSVIDVGGTQVRIDGRFLRIAQLQADRYEFLDDAQPLIERLGRCGRRVDLFTFIQRLPETEPKYKYPMEWDNLAVLPVTSFDHWWNEQIGFKARNKAKQAKKRGVEVREAAFDDNLVKGIWEVYNESETRQGGKNRHFGKSLEMVHRETATFLETSIFIAAYLQEELIGFIKLVYDRTRTQAGLMNIISMVRHRDKAPTNALLMQAVRSCADRGISHLVYAKFAYGKKEHSSLSDFKERNGFQRVDLPRYYVPLTALGSIALRLGFHHKLAERIPESIASRLRDFRAAWYNRKFQSATEAS